MKARIYTRLRDIRHAQRFQKEHYDKEFEVKSCPWNSSVQELVWKKRINFALKHMPENAVVLDLGCGDGTVSRGISAKAKAVVGVDISAQAINRARSINSEPNTSYVISTAEDFHTSSKFDAVLLFDVIEHVFDPLLVLCHVNSMTRKGGLVIMSTPNKNRLINRISRLLGRKIKSLESHLCEYSFVEMKGLFRKSGFSILNREGIILGPDSIEIFFRKALNLKLHIPRFINKIALNMGSLFPSLASYMYILAVKVTDVKKCETA